ncbi:MAG: hypothetical protein ABMA26_03105 [Limisphaerales bacterium]
MHPRSISLVRSCLIALMLGLVVCLTGCGTTEPDNQSSRPWNSPKGWESGVPGMLYDRR